MKGDEKDRFNEFVRTYGPPTGMMDPRHLMLHFYVYPGAKGCLMLLPPLLLAIAVIAAIAVYA